MPQDIPAICDGCGYSFSIDHALSCPKGGLFLARNDDDAKDWGALGSWALIPGAITYKPKINSSAVQVERTGSVARQKSGTADGGTDTVGDAQGGSGPTVKGADVLARRTVHVEVPAESRADVSAHTFWKRGATAMFDILIVNLDAGSHLRMTLEKDLANVEKEKNYLYLQACLERRSTFTPMVYSADVIPRAEALSAQKRLATLLSYKLEREYTEMYDFVWMRM